MDNHETSVSEMAVSEPQFITTKAIKNTQFAHRILPHRDAVNIPS